MRTDTLRDEVRHWKERAEAAEAKLAAVRAALEFVFDQFDELVNQHYGGELPCTDEQIKQFEQARALAKPKATP